MSLRKLSFLALIISNCLALPAHLKRDVCLSDAQAMQLYQQWADILSQSASAVAPQALLSDDYKEYSASFALLDAGCLQSDDIDPSPPWNKPVFSNLSQYQDYASSSTRAALLWHQPLVIHDCQNIAVRGYMTIQGDLTEINSVAMFSTESDGSTGFKINSLAWEFDHGSAAQVLANRGQCTARVIKANLPTILI